MEDVEQNGAVDLEMMASKPSITQEEAEKINAELDKVVAAVNRNASDVVPNGITAAELVRIYKSEEPADKDLFSRVNSSLGADMRIEREHGGLRAFLGKAQRLFDKFHDVLDKTRR